MDSAKQRLTDNPNESGTEQDFQTQHLSQKFDSGKEEIPEDSHNAVYLTFVLYGIGVLMPFNVIMSCLDFYSDTVSSQIFFKPLHRTYWP